VQELLRHRLEVLQHLLLQVQLLLGGGGQLLFTWLVLSKDLEVYELQKTTIMGERGNDQDLEMQNEWLHMSQPGGKRPAAVPGDEDVDEARVGVQLEGDVVPDPLVDALRGGVLLELVEQLLLQLHQGEQEAQAPAVQHLQHPLLVLVALCMEEPTAMLALDFN